MRRTTEERFWEKVDKSGDCWVWTSFKPDGYGRIWEGGSRLAHRLSWELTNGPVPEGMRVLHQCDNPACVKPDHLWIGTVADNNEDCNKKGRRNQARGERCAQTKIDEQTVKEIRSLYQSGVSCPEIANRVGLYRTAVWKAATGRTWRHIA